MAESPVELGSVVAGRYRVDRVLGAGTMGVVVAAWHLELEQTVAIKFLNPSGLGAAEASTRFRREARAAARIKSEHVARVLDVGALESGLPFMVMEFLDGVSLDEELTARGMIPVQDAVNYVLQVIDALAEAHAFGIVHRDLKPANLFVSRRADRSTVIKVLDFGISKIMGDGFGPAGVGLTRTGTIVGSPLYMSPEQLRSTKTVDQRADIWALGTILYQLVTGRTPYNADSAPDLYAMLLRDTPAPISNYRPDLPVGLDAVIHRCLERSPEQRYTNVSELADALLPFAAPEARVHAERARRVLFGAVTEPSAQSFEVLVETESRAAPVPAPSMASTGGAGPLTLTNRKTLRSNDAGPLARRKLWPILGLSLALGGGLFAVMAMRGNSNDPQSNPSVNASRTEVSAIERPAPVVEPAPAEPAPVVTPTTLPPLAASASAAPPKEAAPVPQPVAKNWPAPGAVRAPGPLPAKAAPAPAPSRAPALPSSAAHAVSDFGGRK